MQNLRKLSVNFPGPDPRLLLAGPFATDSDALSMQDKFGRLAATAVYYDIIVEILRELR